MEYYVYRFYSDNRKDRLILSGVTLEEARRHCNDPETSSKTAKNGRGKCTCDWFDGYADIKKIEV